MFLFFRNTYPEHTFDSLVCTYVNENYKNITVWTSKFFNYFLDPLKDSEIPKELLLPPSNINRYRIPDEYDVVMRLRIDTEIELFDNIKQNIYYTVIDTETSCSDNIGYATLEVMKKYGI